NIRSATFYPVLILSFATLVVLGMMFFIVPLFVNFFPAGLELPLATKIIVGLSESLRHFWYFWILGVAGIVFGIRYYVNSPSGRRAWDRLKFRVPAFGPVFHRATTARFLRTLATLLGGGIPVLQALEASGAAAGNSLVAEAAAAAAEKIQEGKSIAGPLEESGFFPPMVIQMVAIGEESGALPFLLTRVAEFYEEEVATMTKGLAAVIEPLMIIFVGCIVAVIILSLYLPIFLVVTTVGT
ncbi:MAG TPA: type II secretion system F family protein, partial [Desulfotomaculum sp.]|nr:type II secretion system F family protein [Desulfotomaculum sp.]